MAEPTKLVSIRLKASDIEKLQARAFTLSAKVSGVARDLILTGLAGGDQRALAHRLMLIERRLTAIEQLSQDSRIQAQSVDKASQELLAMFDALLQALTSERASDRRTA